MSNTASQPATRAIRRALQWTLPPVIYRGARRVARQWRSWRSSLHPDLARNAELRGRHHGERAFVIATGPSIKQQDLKALRGEVCIGVSNFFVHADYHVIRPQYHCIAPWHEPLTDEQWSAWMDEAAARTGDATMLFPLADKARNLRGGRFIGREVHLVNIDEDLRLEQLNRVDLTRPLPAPQSVPIMALAIAIDMGFSEVYLLGCDHDWILHMGESRHFYAERDHAMNRKGHNEWYEPGYGDQFRCYHRLWTQYEQIKRLAQAAGTRIYNATSGGLLDVFERRALSDVVGQSNESTLRRAA